VNRARLTRGQALGWSVIGFGAGVVTGFLTGQWLGRITRARVGSEVLGPEIPGPPGPALVLAAAEAIDTDPRLHPYGLKVNLVTGRAVELSGWVPDRPTRTRAMRLIQSLPGIDSVINSILVRGEDDLHVPPDESPATQSA
jgi:BON domain-containing protein